ncbi:MAG: ABC transporter permease [Acidobacteriia bacterium]|nr:ABC transporter permease [Terriglobia bacterium]
MFLRLVADSFSRRLSRKLLTAGALALGMAVATAALSVSLDVGDRLAREFRSLGANLLLTPHADSLPLEIGGVDYRPANAGAYLPAADLPKLKTVFWRHNIVGFAPILEVPVEAWSAASQTPPAPGAAARATLIGTWSQHAIAVPDGGTFVTGVEKTNPWWNAEPRWFAENEKECVVGQAFARRAGVRLGDTLQIRAGGETLALTVSGLLTTGGPEDEAIVAPLALAQQLAGQPGMYRRLYVSALTKPEDAFGRRDPKSMTPAEFDRWFCTPYVSAIALQVEQALPGTDARVIRRVAEGEGRVLTRVRNLLWLVAAAALLAAALAVGATSAAMIIERRTEIALMKALGAGSGMVKSLFAAEQILLALVGGAAGYAIGIVLARLLGQIVFGAAPEPSGLVFAVVLALAVGVTLLGSFFSMRRAAAFEPAPILRGE